MKLLKTALLAGAFFAVTTSQAQTVQEIVAKHNKAVGGEEAWNKVTSFKAEGTITVTAQNFSMAFLMAMVKDKAVRQEQTVMGETSYAVLTPTGGWAVRGTKTKEISADTAKKAFGESAENFTDDLIDAAQHKYKMELQGKETINGKEAYKISVIDNDADESIYYVDASNYYIVRRSVKTEVEGEEVDQNTDYSDFKTLPPLNLVVAMTETNSQYVQKYKKIEVNVINENDPLFKRPTK